MHAIQFLSVIVGLGCAGEAYAQAPVRGGPAPAPSTIERETPERDDYRPPVYRPSTERDYEPWRRQPKPPPKSTPQPKTQPATSASTPESRSPALARCDDFRRRMEQVIREEQRGGNPARVKALAA